jgi:hypothetical protein
MVNFLKKFSKVHLLDSPALPFFVSPGGENLSQKKIPGCEGRTYLFVID